MKKKTNILKKLNRESAKKQGFYDGRFSTKIIKDKKKEESKSKFNSVELLKDYLENTTEEQFEKDWKEACEPYKNSKDLPTAEEILEINELKNK